MAVSSAVAKAEATATTTTAAAVHQQLQSSGQPHAVPKRSFSPFYGGFNGNEWSGFAAAAAAAAASPNTFSAAHWNAA